MPYCPNCGVEVDGEQKFCGECGARLALDPLPNEPVYTDDERLKNDPALASGDPAPKQKKAPKIPELTLEPDLWGIPVEKPKAEPKPPKKEPELTLEPDVWGLGAAAAAAAKPAEPAQAAPAAAAAPAAVETAPVPVKEKKPVPAEKTETASFSAAAMEDVPCEREKKPKQDDWKQAATSIPNDYTMSKNHAPAEKKIPDETLMLIWAILMTCTFSICGIVGLIKVIKARKTQDPEQKYQLLTNARIWLIVATIFRALPILGELL